MLNMPRDRYPGIRLWFARIIVLIMDAFLATVAFFVKKRKECERGNKKILIIRLDHIGDSVMTIPLMMEIKNRFPGSELHYLCNPGIVPLLEPLNLVDRFYPFTAPWFYKGEGPLEGIKGFFSLAGMLRGERYDIGLDPRGDLRHVLLMRLAGIRYSIGYGITGGGPLLDKVIPYNHEEHIVKQNLRVLQPLLGEAPEPSYPFLTTDDEEVDAVENIAPEPQKGERFVGIQPVARVRHKWWEPEKFARLADLIKEESGFEVVFIGDKGEREYIENIIDLCKHKHKNMAGLFTLRQLPIFLKRLSAVIGCDSGPMHIAAAVGTPTITIFGSLDPRRCQPFGDEELHRVVQHTELSCVPCSSRFCKDDFLCMKMLRVEDVFDEFKRLAARLV